MQGLFNDLKSNGYSFLMTSKLNQDVLESHFSLLRGLGRFYDHPDPVAVTQRTKALLLGKNASNLFKTGNIQVPADRDAEEQSLSANLISEATNSVSAYEEETTVNSEDTENQESIEAFYKTTECPEDFQVQDGREGERDFISKEHSPVEAERTELLEYLAGYIAYRIKKKFPEKFSRYGQHTREGGPQKSDWLSVISRGNLVRPTREWLIQVYKMENDFRHFHGSDLNKV